MKAILIYAFCFCLLPFSIIAQQQDRPSRIKKISPYTNTRPLSPSAEREFVFIQLHEHNELFSTIERGIMRGQVDEVATLFAPHIYLNIRGKETGYYSANQAQFVLQSFFNHNKPLSFNFSTYGESTGMYYATGRGSINVRGNREFIQVYVSLKRHENRWVISQFNIY